MAKPAESAGSDVSEMKTLFKLAHTKPVFVAFAIGGDGKAVIKLDKMMKPKALGKALKGSDPKMKNICCGIVEIDPSDASTAKFTMDKAASGIESKLIAALKGSGVSKVNIGVGGGDAGPAGGAPDDDDDDAPAGAATAQPSPPAAAAASPPASPPAATATPSAPASPPASPPAAAAPMSPPAAAAPASPPAAGAAPGQDAGALTATLTGLVKQMMTAISGNPALKATLVPLATAAQGALKQGNPQQASTAIASLQQALAGGGGAAPNAAGTPPSPPSGAAATPSPPSAAAAPTPPPMTAAGGPPPMGSGGPPPPPGPGDGGVRPSDTPAGRAHAKAGIAWKATHNKMTGDIDQVTSKFLEAFKDHAQAEELQKAFKAKIDGVLGKLDQSLSAKLGELDGAKDAAAHAKIVADAKKILAQYQQTVSSDPTIAQLDKNPFAPVGLQKTLTTTLTTLAKVLV